MNRSQPNCYLPHAGSEQIYEIPAAVQVPASSFDKRNQGQPTTGIKDAVGPRSLRIGNLLFKVFLLLFVISSATFSMLSYTRSPPEVKIKEEVAKVTASFKQRTYNSCIELRKDGFNISKIYEIQPHADYPSYKVYCDMVSDGGGWTLVASIHEDSISSKCTSGDKWSLTSDTYGSKGPYLWSNLLTYGSIESASSEDFKSKAYTLPASDVLIAHVPNDVKVDEIENSSITVYHTTDGFLLKYGSSLQTLYRDYVPLSTNTMFGLEEKVVHLIERYGGITQQISNWYNYNYDAGKSASYIIDGGSDMFDYGNRVYFSVNNEPYKLIDYGRAYTNSLSYRLTSAAIYPFISLATVSTGNQYLHSFRIKVESNVDTGYNYDRDSYSEYYRKYYYYGRSAEVYYSSSTGNPTICKMFFFIRGYMGYSTNSYNYPSWSASGTKLTFTWEVYNPKNLLVGYMLLSRKSGYGFSSTDIRNVMRKLVDYTDSVNPSELAGPNPSIIVPVSFVKGRIRYSNQNVTSGFLQLRVFDRNGASYAMCPGVQLMENADPALYCIGSGSTKSYDSSRCGDFAAWDKLPEHYEINRTPGGLRFINDFESTILIFTR